MARPRIPLAILQARGSYSANPGRLAQRRGNEPRPTTPIGDPPARLNPAERAAWREIVRTAHPGTLSGSDRLHIEHGSRLLVAIRAQSDYTDHRLMDRWTRFLSHTGLTPSDRSRVSALLAEPVNPFSTFAQPPRRLAGSSALCFPGADE